MLQPCLCKSATSPCTGPWHVRIDRRCTRTTHVHQCRTGPCTCPLGACRLRATSCSCPLPLRKRVGVPCTCKGRPCRCVHVSGDRRKRPCACCGPSCGCTTCSRPFERGHRGPGPYDQNGPRCHLTASSSATLFLQSFVLTPLTSPRSVSNSTVVWNSLSLAGNASTGYEPAGRQAGADERQWDLPYAPSGRPVHFRSSPSIHGSLPTSAGSSEERGDPAARRGAGPLSGDPAAV